MRFKVWVKVKLVVVAILVFQLTSVLNAQTKQLVSWRESLAQIQGYPAAERASQHNAVAQIRAGIELWLKLHPGTTIKLEVAPSQPWSAEQTLKQIALLREVVDVIIKADPNQSFELGMTQISVTAEASPLSPLTDSIGKDEISNLHRTNVTQAIQGLPGVNVDRKSARNQTGIMIRGFDTRQVGIYMDNIPLYIPYDGYADISRFLASDIAEIEVAKGYSSPLIGPNGLGGAVNLVTRRPEKKFEGDISMGTGSGQMVETGVHIGSRWDKFFFRGGMDWLQTDYYPLSGDFKLNSVQPNFHRTNSSQRDVRYNGRIGYTPKGQDQYVFTYTNQKGDYNSPPYSGADTTNNKVRYWQWPYWNRESYYLNTRTGLGESSDIKFRAFYDHYPNSMNTFSDLNYSALSSSSKYDDYSSGGSAELGSKVFSRHNVGASIFYKNDTHEETGAVGVQPWRTHRDQQVSMGFQDAFTLTSRLKASVGLSIDHLDAFRADNLITTTVGKGKTATTVYSVAPFSTLANEWTYNPLASISYTVEESGILFFTFSKKSHFPTMKDRYSYKNNQALPNPALQPEQARNWNLGYSHTFAFKTMVQLDLFHNDVYDSIQKVLVPAQFSGQCSALSNPNICEQSVNIGKERRQGAEVTVRSSAITHLTLDANYSYLRRTVSDKSVIPENSPKHKVVGSAGWQLPRKILVMATARYESGAVTSNDSGLAIPSSKFATADLSGVAPIYSGVTLRLGVKNIFDRNYYYQEGFPEAGRSWYFNMLYKF